MENLKARYSEQFPAMEAAVASLKSTENGHHKYDGSMERLYETLKAKIYLKYLLPD